MQQKQYLMARSPSQSKVILKIKPDSLGHWIEVNDEIMALLSRYEPPLEVEEKDSTFLKIERSTLHIVTCSQCINCPCKKL